MTAHGAGGALIQNSTTGHASTNEHSMLQSVFAEGTTVKQVTIKIVSGVFINNVAHKVGDVVVVDNITARQLISANQAVEHAADQEPAAADDAAPAKRRGK